MKFSVTGIFLYLSPMRTLFVKIFLWFWLAMALIIAAFIYSASLVPSNVPSEPVRRMVGNALALNAETAMDRIEREGPAGAVALAERVKKATGIEVYVYDPAGREMTGKPVSPENLQIARKVAGQNETAFEPLPNIFLAGRRVFNARGEMYVLVSETPRIRFNPWRDEPEKLTVRILAILLTGGLVCYGLARYLTGPVKKLRTAANQFAAGDLATRVTPRLGRRRDELVSLARDFDGMAERIEALVVSQRRLLSDISHELRSPLARLYVALGIARRRAGGDAAEALNRIERETERLNELIGEVLTLAKMEANSLNPDDEPVDLALLVREVATDADFEAREAGKAVCILSCEECTVAGSHELLHRAVENVIRNAVKYTEPDTAVEITVGRAGPSTSRAAVVRVRDHGPGIPEAELANIFKPFYRISDARDRASGGVGLGLAITERAVRLHAGTIDARNESGGFVVEMRFPLSPRTEAEVPGQPAALILAPPQS